MKLTCAAVIIALALGSGTTVFAQHSAAPTAPTAASRATPNLKDVEALIALEDWSGKLAGLRDTFAGQMQLAVNSPAWQDLSPSTREQLGKDLAEVMARMYAWPGQLSVLVQDIYLTQASSEDVSTLLDYYRSSDGQWMVHRLQPALDRVEYAMLDRTRRDLSRLTQTWLASERPSADPASVTPEWQPANAHEAAARQLLAATSVAAWGAQMFEMRLRAIDRFTEAANRLPDRPERFQGFTAEMRSQVSLEAYMPQLVGELTQQLSHDELARASAIEASAQRQRIRALDKQIGQAFSQRMDAWQRDTLFPALRDVMTAARQNQRR